MKNKFYIFNLTFTLLLLFQVKGLQGQSVEISCPSDLCGARDDFGMVDGMYSESGSMENGQPIYTGPGATGNYTIRCQTNIVIGLPFPIYRWEVQNTSGDVVYFNDKVDPAPFAFTDTAAGWTSENSDYNPAPESIAVLPVDLVEFSAGSEEKSIRLSWQTASEYNNAGFEVQRSSDNRNWQSLDFIDGWGTSYEPETYTYVDESPLAGVNYYRLKQKDYDGAFAYSFVVKAEYQSAAVRIYPNPVTAGQITIRMPDEQEANSTVEIYDRLGRLVQTNFLTYGQAQVDISELPFGVYLLRLEQNGRSHNERLIIK